MKSRRLIAAPRPKQGIVSARTDALEGLSMSALGQKQTIAPQQAMPAIGHKLTWCHRSAVMGR
jgi:hypothetical protein